MTTLVPLTKAERAVILDGLKKLVYGYAVEVANKLEETKCERCGGNGYAPYVGGEDADPCGECDGTGFKNAPGRATGAYVCPRCERLTTKPWEAAWCGHHDSSFTPYPPEGFDEDPDDRAVRMVPVKSVEFDPAEFADTPFWVVEYDVNATPIRHVVNGPYSSDREAYTFAAYRKACAKANGRREPSHRHGFEVWPEDLIAESWR